MLGKNIQRNNFFLEWCPLKLFSSLCIYKFSECMVSIMKILLCVSFSFLYWSDIIHFHNYLLFSDPSRQQNWLGQFWTRMGNQRPLWCHTGGEEQWTNRQISRCKACWIFRGSGHTDSSSSVHGRGHFRRGRYSPRPFQPATRHRCTGRSADTEGKPGEDDGHPNCSTGGPGYANRCSQQYLHLNAEEITGINPFHYLVKGLTLT